MASSAPPCPATGPAWWPNPNPLRSVTLFDPMDDPFDADLTQCTAEEAYLMSMKQRMVFKDIWTPPARFPKATFQPSRASSDGSELPSNSSLNSSSTASHTTSSTSSSSSKTFGSSESASAAVKKLCSALAAPLKKLSSSLRSTSRAFSSSSRRSSSSFSSVPLHSEESSECSSECQCQRSSACSDDQDSYCSEPVRKPLRRISPLQSFSDTLGPGWRRQYPSRGAAAAAALAVERQQRAADREAWLDAELRAWAHANEHWAIPGWVGSQRQRACGAACNY